MVSRLLRALGLVLALSAASVPRADGSSSTITILISIDGFRADYIARGLTPTMALLASGGVRSSAMRPSYPSLTFPNHYALVTGRHPDRSGVVNNYMEDPARPGIRFGPHEAEESRDPFWWNGAEPLWVTAERAGILTATMFWPGSEVPISGVRPRYWAEYDLHLPAPARVDRVLNWLDRPERERPRFVTLYFEGVDMAGHGFGPDSPELNAELERVDHALTRLVSGLTRRGLFSRTNIIIVSDHGMAPVSPERVTFLEDIVPLGLFRAVSVGAEATIAPVPGHEEDVGRALLAAHPHMTCWRKDDVPARFRYGTHPRVPPFVCLAETGWLIRANRESTISIRGHHGYDPLDPLMAALFLAHGPAFRRGFVQPPIEVVDVYPLLARLVGVRPISGDGDISRLLSSLTPSRVAEACRPDSSDDGR